MRKILKYDRVIHQCCVTQRETTIEIQFKDEKMKLKGGFFSLGNGGMQINNNKKNLKKTKNNGNNKGE